MSIVRIIIEQLTPGTIFMLGGKDTVVSIEDGRGIRFVVRQSPRRVNQLELVLAADDTYTLRFMRITNATLHRSFKIETTALVEGLHHDQLHEAIERHTGLCARMPRVIFGSPR